MRVNVKAIKYPRETYCFVCSGETDPWAVGLRFGDEPDRDIHLCAPCARSIGRRLEDQAREAHDHNMYDGVSVRVRKILREEGFANDQMTTIGPRDGHLREMP